MFLSCWSTSHCKLNSSLPSYKIWRFKSWWNTLFVTFNIWEVLKVFISTIFWFLYSDITYTTPQPQKSLSKLVEHLLCYFQHLRTFQLVRFCNFLIPLLYWRHLLYSSTPKPTFGQLRFWIVCAGSASIRRGKKAWKSHFLISNTITLKILTSFRPFNVVAYLVLFRDLLACAAFYLDGSNSGFRSLIYKHKWHLTLLLKL